MQKSDRQKLSNALLNYETAFREEEQRRREEEIQRQMKIRLLLSNIAALGANLLFIYMSGMICGEFTTYREGVVLSSLISLIINIPIMGEADNKETRVTALINMFISGCFLWWIFH